MPKAKTTSQVSRKNTRAALVANKTVAAGAVALPAITAEAIAARAYSMYVSEGCPDGRHLDHWFAAEAELRG
jgi:hypothetical protein